MEDMKKLYESKINDLSNELTACICKLEGTIKKVPFTTPPVVKYLFIYKGKALFSITNNNEWYKIKVWDNYSNGFRLLKVPKDNLDIAEVYKIMERKYNEQQQYGDIIEPINSMINLLVSYMNNN